MELRFPALDGGQEQGLNDAGVEAFQGSIGKYVVRECAQNSGDAPEKDGETVRVEFEFQTWSTQDLPCLEQIRDAMRSSRDYWSDDQKTRKFFERALENLRHGQVPVLKISDYGTTGLVGDDVTRNKGWFALVKSQGVSVKPGESAGGSFGIGKSSPFAASRLRTVFYGTRTLDGQVALQGVCRLVTHLSADRRKTQAVGFIGGFVPGKTGEDPVFTAVRDPAAMPSIFKRDLPGTDIYIPGYFSQEENRERELVISILNNFWPAIYRGSMEFRVGKQEITKDNLGKLINNLRSTDELNAHLYYCAVVDPKRVVYEEKLSTVGKCQLILSTSGAELPKKVCLMRRAGMVIDFYGPRNVRTQYTGMFVCEDKKGNTLLRQMEPPRHDRWDPKRVEGRSGKEALNEIQEWIREKVRALNPIFEGESFDEEDLSKYIPDLEDQGISGESESEEPGTKEGIYGVPPDKVADPEPLPVGRIQAGVEAGGQGENAGDNSGGSTGRPDPKGGDGKDTGGKVRRRGSGKRNNATGLTIRSYAVKEEADEYLLVLRAQEEFSGTVRVVAACDDDVDSDLELDSCTVEGDGRQLKTAGNSISDVVVPALSSVTLRMRFKRPQRVSLMLVNS